MSTQIIRNAIKCNECGTIIESKHRHDFVYCSCPTDSPHRCAVDGGTDYMKRTGNGNWEEMSEVSER